MKTILLSPNFPFLFQEPRSPVATSVWCQIVLARLRAKFEFSQLARSLCPANDSDYQLQLIEGGQS